MSELDEFISKNYSWFVETWRNYPWVIQRADSARYFLMHQYGGFYLDLDITCKKSFDAILEEVAPEIDTIVSDAPEIGVDTPMVFSKPGTPFMELTQQRLMSMNIWYILPYFTIYMSTGPYMLSASYWHFPCKETIHVLPMELSRKKYFRHGQSGTWHTWDTEIIETFLRFYETGWLVVVLLIIVVYWFVVALLISAVCCRKFYKILSKGIKRIIYTRL